MQLLLISLETILGKRWLYARDRKFELATKSPSSAMVSIAEYERNSEFCHENSIIRSSTNKEFDHETGRRRIPPEWARELPKSGKYFRTENRIGQYKSLISL